MSNMVHLEEGILSRLKFALAKIYHSGSTRVALGVTLNNRLDFCVTC
jgi:hypothetical protein